MCRATVGWGRCYSQHHKPSSLKRAGCRKHVIAFTCYPCSLDGSGKIAVLRVKRKGLICDSFSTKERHLQKMVLKTQRSDIVSYRGDGEWEALWSQEESSFSVSVVFSVNTWEKNTKYLGCIPRVDRRPGIPGLVQYWQKVWGFKVNWWVSVLYEHALEHTHACTHAYHGCRSQRTTCRRQFSPSTMGSEAETPVLNLGSKCPPSPTESTQRLWQGFLSYTWYFFGSKMPGHKGKNQIKYTHI